MSNLAIAAADRLSNPATQDGIAIRVERMTGTILDIPIGKFAAAMERSIPGANRGRNRIRANDTIADIAGRDADHLPEQLGDSSREMMGMMSGLAAAFATMIPEFERISRDVDDKLEDIERDRRNRD